MSQPPNAPKFTDIVVAVVREGLLVLDSDLQITRASESFCRLFELAPDQTEGRPIFEVGEGRLDIPALRDLLERDLPEHGTRYDVAIEHEFEGLGLRSLLVNAHLSEEHQLILLAVEDATRRKQAEERVRRMASEVATAENQERRRIARILHDELQQWLYAIDVRLDATLADAEVGATQAVLRHLPDLKQWLNGCREVVRNLTADMSPPVLRHENFVGVLTWLAARMQKLYGLEVVLDFESDLPVRDEGIRALLYRGVRELLFNVVKHADTLKATVVVRLEDDLVEITVADAGRGFDPDEATSRAEPNGHFGLTELRNRLEFFEGSLTIDSEPGRGTRSTIRLRLGES